MKTQSACLLLLPLSLFLSAWPAFGDGTQRTLEIYWVDVEGGGATLIVTPAGESVLVDTGLPGGRDPQRIYQVAAQVAGLKRIDHLVTTHFDTDHYGGAAELSALMPIVNVWDNGIPDRDPGKRNDERFAQLIEPYRNMKIGARHRIEVGRALPLTVPPDNTALPFSVRFLAAKQEFITQSVAGNAKTNPLCAGARDKIRESNDNGNSVVLLMSFGPFRFYDGADLLWDLEKELVCPVNRVGEVDLFQVTHHGLDVSNNPLLVKSLNPVVAVMVNGTTKGCGPETFDLLSHLPSLQAIYQVHKNLRPDGSVNNTPDEYIANLEKDCAANFIKCAVARDGRAYTLSIPAKGHSRTFKTKLQ